MLNFYIEQERFKENGELIIVIQEHKPSTLYSNCSQFDNINKCGQEII